jgi:uncharacterized protein with GYD domain
MVIAVLGARRVCLLPRRKPELGSYARNATPLGLPPLLALKVVWLGGAGQEATVATYILLSTLTDEGAKTMKKRPERIREVNQELEKFGVQVLQQYAVLGPYDFVNIVEAPDNHAIARVSAELASRGSIKIMTLPAMPIDAFIADLQAKE